MGNENTACIEENAAAATYEDDRTIPQDAN
jgi:hypothetical protein